MVVVVLVVGAVDGFESPVPLVLAQFGLVDAMAEMMLR